MELLLDPKNNRPMKDVPLPVRKTVSSEILWADFPLKSFLSSETECAIFARVLEARGQTAQGRSCALDKNSN